MFLEFTFNLSCTLLHTYMQVEDKSKKIASHNQTLKRRVAELEEQLDWKEKQIGEKNRNIQQV